MKQTKTLFAALFYLATTSNAAQPWKLFLVNPEEGVKMKIDLYEETVNVPGMDMFGPMNGYMAGKGIWGTWMVTSFTIESDKQATLRFSNDQGSETQAVCLTQQTDSTYLMELQGGVVVKKVVNKKLQKLPPKMFLRLSK